MTVPEVYEQSPSFIPVRGTGGNYVLGLPVLILKTPNPGIRISGFDTQSGSNNPNGIFRVLFMIMGKLFGSHGPDQL